MAALIAVGGLALLIGLPWLVWRGPYMIDAKYLDRKGLADGSAALVTGLRTAAVACVAALGAGIALLYTARTYRLTRRGQITERFTKALERLDSERQYVRIGGILALEQIVQDAPEQAATDAARVLGHFLRDHAPTAQSPTSGDDPLLSVSGRLPKEPAADVQAALTALTRPESRTHVDARETLDLRGLHLAGAQLRQADLTHANLAGSTLTDADLAWATLAYANLGGATLTHASLGGATLAYANLDRATLAYASLDRATLAYANLGGATLTHASLGGATLAYANLDRATLTYANLGGATLTYARLGGATLTDAELSGATLTHADLSEATLTGVYLLRAILTHAKLRGATFTDAELGGAILTHADLRGADLSGVRGLTQPLAETLTDESTILPPER